MNRIWEFLKYQVIAKNLHGTHSPFVYELYENVFDPNISFYAFQEIEERRQYLLASTELIHFEDHGAGSKTNGGRERQVKDIVRCASKPKKYGELLFRLTKYLDVQCSLELGTSVGIGSAYIAKANNTKHYTIEGAPEVHRIAKETFNTLNLNVRAICSTFKNAIPTLNKKFDLIFIDGHHHGPCLLEYIEMLKPHLNDEGVFVLDDIRWSNDMLHAWQQVINDPKFQITIDLFEMGMAFKRSSQSKQHFILRY